VTDVGTTKRKPLTPTQRLKLFEAFKGKCCLCEQPIRGKWIDEHLRALGLGGTNEWDNRGPAHKACADAKTHGPDGDLARISKAKRQKMARHGIKDEKRARIPTKPKVARGPRSLAAALTNLPRKALFR
jgi:5-methylcytosine-specific restriction protein A